MKATLFCFAFAASALAGPPIGIAPSALTQGEQLQAVVDRGGPIVWIPKGAYQQDVSLRLRSNLTLFCEEGAVIEAAEGAFKAAGDVPEASLVVLDQVADVAIHNCTFGMRKADYGVYRPAPLPLAANVNLDGYALSAANVGRGWPDRMSVDARCGPGQAENLKGCYESLRSTAKAGCGRYISGSRVQAAVTDYPPEAVLESSMPSGSIVAYGTRNYADIRKPDVLLAFAGAIAAELTARPGPMVLVDNIVHPSADATWPFSWTLTCDLLGKLRKPDRKIIANVAGASWSFTDSDCALLAASVDGMAFEMPFHRTARDSAAKAQRQIEVYRRWLDAGKTVVLIPVDSSLTTEADKEAEARYVAAFAMIVRKPTQPMHVATPYFKAAPDWAPWPKDWGIKHGEYTMDGTAIVQAFDAGTLRIIPPRTVEWTANAAYYVPSEFRHCLRITGSQRVLLSNVKAESSGGDGLYVGPTVLPDKTRIPCRDVRVEKSTFADNHRQGVSLVSCMGDCIVEDCVFTGTKGTSPQAGIDVEPEWGDTVEATIRRCQSIGNRGPAYMTGLFKNQPTDAPSKITFADCTWAAVPADQPTFRAGGLHKVVELKDGARWINNGYPAEYLPVGTVVTWNGLDVVRK